MNPTAAILKKIGILAGIVVACLILWMVLVYFPTSKNNEQFEVQKKNLEAKVSSEISDNQVRFMQILVDSLSTTLTNAEARIYPLNKLLQLGHDIEAICKKHDLNLLTITPDYEKISLIYKEQQEVSELPLGFRVEGKFAQLSQFLDAIPTFPFLMRVNEFNIQKKDIIKDANLVIEFKGAVVLRKERVDEVTNDNLNLPNKA